MKLRWKLFFFLLIFTLIPLFFVTAVSQKATKEAGEILSRETRLALLELSEKALVIAARNAAEVQLREEKGINFRLVSMARKVEYFYSLGDLPQPGQVYWNEEFNDPAKAPQDLDHIDGFVVYGQDGSVQPNKLSLEHSVFLKAPGVVPHSHKHDLTVLQAMIGEFKSIFKDSHFKARFYVAMESGLMASYPGFGGFPDGYDPRLKPWYRAALTQSTEDAPVAWTFPMVNEATGQAVFSGSTLIRDTKGNVVGVAAVDVKLEDILELSRTPYAMDGELEAFDVHLFPNPDTGETGALVLAHDDYINGSRAWTGMVSTEWLSSGDKFKFQKILESMENGETGHARLDYKGEDSLWAYAPVGDTGYFKILVTPMSSINSQIEETDRELEELTRMHLKVNGGAAMLALLMVTICAIVISKFFTRYIHTMVSAVQRLAKGDFSVKMDFEISDERGDIIRAFNEMVPKLRESVRLKKAMELAHEVQQNLLPAAVPHVEGLDISGSIVYSDETGGDYYDYLEIDETNNHKITVVVGDVSGHGIPSALLMTTARALFRQRSSMSGSITSIVSDVNRLLTRDVAESGRFMTLFYMDIDTQKRHVKWLRAGHDPAMVYDTNTNTFCELGGRGMFLGGMADYNYQEYEKEIQPGQIIVVGTDGVWETRNQYGQMFGKKAFKKIIEDHAHESAREIMEAVFTAVEEFRQPVHQEDDITLVIVKVLDV